MKLDNMASTLIAAMWSNAARTLTADPATDPGAATLVWGHAGRSLTTLANVFLTSSQGLATVATLSTFTFAPSANSMVLADIGIDNLAATTATVHMYDGTTQMPIGAVPTATPQHFLVLVAPTLQFQIKNLDNTNVVDYMYNAIKFPVT